MVQKLPGILNALFILISTSCTVEDGASQYTQLYVGTYTNPTEALGIYLCAYQEQSGELESSRPVASVVHPSFLTISPNGKNLYAVSELSGENVKTGYVHAFRINGDFGLTPLDSEPSGGQSPCHLGMDSEGQFLFVVNYFGGVVKMFKVINDGHLLFSDSLSFEFPEIPEASNLHASVVSPDGRFLFLPDKGQDRIWVCFIDRNSGRISHRDSASVRLPETAGPRHFTFHPSGKFAYVINELANTIHAYTYDSLSGKLTDMQQVTTLPKGYDRDSYAADIHVHPSGRFLYGSNRGHDSIVIFKVDHLTGMLTYVSHESSQGSWPRNFFIDYSGDYLWVANQKSNTITRYSIDPKTGQLKFLGKRNEVPLPTCLLTATSKL